MEFDLRSAVPALTMLALLLAITIGLALYRLFVARREDLHLHVASEEAGTVAQQSSVADRLNWIDRWGKTFTVAALIYFTVLLLVVLYFQWVQSTRVLPGS